MNPNFDKSIQVSDKEILSICKGKVNIVQYHDLALVYSIDEIFKPELNNCVIMLLELTEGNHWVTLIKKDNIIEYYNSYGKKPDAELNLYKYRQPYLSNLLYKSGYMINWSNQLMQQFKNDVNTCGRWASLRAVYHELDNFSFNRFMKNINVLHTPDDKVSIMTTVAVKQGENILI